MTGGHSELYPPTVTGILAVEPDPTARAAAATRAAEARIPVDVVDGVASALPAEDGVFDVVVLIWVLGSVPDPLAALGEIRRVLVPGGELRFYEHVCSRHVAVRGLQRAVDALFWTRALGGCETARDTEATIRATGFEIVSLDRGFHSSSVLTITSAPYVLGIPRS